MNIKRLLYGNYSKYVISIILGFGLATLFRYSCNSNNCIRFVAPSPSILKKVFKYEDGCMKLTHKPVKCNPLKKTVRFTV
jgi:hypothetical protein